MLLSKAVQIQTGLRDEFSTEMPVCARCREDLPQDGDFITCFGYCKSDFHYNCSTLKESTWRRMTADKKDAWRCTSCQKPREIASSTAAAQKTIPRQEDIEEPKEDGDNGKEKKDVLGEINKKTG